MITLEQQCQDTVGALRAALIDLYDSVGADPAAPQDVARAYHLSSTLTWNIAKLMQTADGLAAVPHVPGAASIEKILKATRANGATETAVSKVRSAVDEFEKMIEVHVGDRATLDLIIDGIASNGAPGLELSRKRAYHGNSGIYGVQAKTNVMTCYLSPNADDPDQLDMAMVRGYVGLRRLRPTVRLPIFRVRQWSEAGQDIGSKQWMPLNPDAPSPILSQFSRGEVPEIETLDTPSGTDYVIDPGPIGNRGAFDCFAGDMIRAGASRYATDDDTTGEFGVTNTIPSEQLILDLIVHKDLDYALAAKTFIYAYFFTDSQVEGAWDECSLLPIQLKPAVLAGSPPAVATPLVPKYADILGFVFERLGCQPKECRGLRLHLKYPPLGSAAVLRFDLPERP